MEATVRVKTCAPAHKDISETDAITQVSVFINISGGGGGRGGGRWGWKEYDKYFCRQVIFFLI